MCRAIHEGGRRCPCSSPARRSAYRKALRGMQTVTPIGAGGTTVPADETPAWDPDSVHRNIDQLNELLANPSDETLREAEQLTMRIGAAVADETARRTGLDTAQMHAENKSWLEDTDARIKSLEKEHEQVLSDHREHPDTPRFNDYPDRDSYWQAREQFKAREDVQAMEARLREIETELSEQRRLAGRGIKPGLETGLQKIADTQFEVLREFRDFGGEAALDDKTQKSARDAVNEALAVFPSDWVDAHNRADFTSSKQPVLARMSKARAHYTGATWKSTKKKETIQSITMQTKGDEAPEDTPWTKHEMLTPEDFPENDRHMYAWEVDDMYRRTEMEVRSAWGDNPEPPRGRGWELYEHERYGKYWRRPKTRMRVVESALKPELTINKQRVLLEGRSDTIQVASHELSHRFEDSVPEIGMLEHEHINRRTRGAEGGRAPLVKLYGPRSKEVSRPDSFAHAYMGKDYNSGVYHEVLSCSMEALYSGDFGGFIGVGRYEPDPESRHFALGLLAGVRPRQRG